MGIKPTTSTLAAYDAVNYTIKTLKRKLLSLYNDDLNSNYNLSKTLFVFKNIYITSKLLKLNYTFVQVVNKNQNQPNRNIIKFKMKI